MSGETMTCGRCGREEEPPVVRGMRLTRPSGWVDLAVHGSNPDARARLCADCWLDLLSFLHGSPGDLRVAAQALGLTSAEFIQQAGAPS